MSPRHSLWPRNLHQDNLKLNGDKHPDLGFGPLNPFGAIKLNTVGV